MTTRLRLVLASMVVTGSLLFASSGVAVAADPSAPGASTCVECCKGDAVCEALAGLEDMRATIVELAPPGGLTKALLAKINSIEASVLRLNVTAALNQLDALGYDLGYLQTQPQTGGSDNRSYTALSNIMKTKHDTVKNSISNIR
jgi:hypothetical protein